MSIQNVSVRIYSITGVLVTSFYNNTSSADNLVVECSELKDGGLDSFSFTIPPTAEGPVFSQMECRIYLGEEWVYTGYATIIPAPDQDNPIILVEGLGYHHKLKKKRFNLSYAAQTLDFIIKDIANTYLGSDIDVYYNVGKITVPAIAGITIEFSDRTLHEVFTELLKIANKDYSTQQYTFGVDKEKELYFSAISNTTVSHLFEGYQYQSPEVETLDESLINKVLAFRTVTGDTDQVEFVNSYEDSASISLNGLYERRLTFPDYIDTTTIENIVNSVLERNSTPLKRVTIQDLEVAGRLPVGFYELSNKRNKYILTVTDLEDLSVWNTSNLVNTAFSLDDSNVFTGRKSLKLVTAAGSAGEYMEYILPTPIKFPELFVLFFYLNDVNGNFTVTLTDSNLNEYALDIDSTYGIGEWIREKVAIGGEIISDNLLVDNGTGDDDLIVDFTALLSDVMIVDKSTGIVLKDIIKVRITINNNNVSTFWIDSMESTANTFLHRKLVLEEVFYRFGKSYLSDASFGEKTDSLIDEILVNDQEGSTALSIFSKQ